MNEGERYTGEFKIKNEVGKNLLETYEVNGRKYTDNLPKNSFISIPKKQYIEYEQQKEEIERLKAELEFEKATNKELLSTGAELEKKLYEEQDKNKRLKKELQEEKEEKEHYQAIVESWE